MNEMLKKEIDRRAFLKTSGLVGIGGIVGNILQLARPTLSLAGAAPAKNRYGGTIKLAWLFNLDTLDPHRTSNLTAIRIHNNIYNGILKIDYDGKQVKFVPDLATDWEIQNNGLIHTFRFRKGVKFHNGDDFNAEDVKYSLERVGNKETGSPHRWKVEAIEKIEILDPYTVKLTYKKPDPFMKVGFTGSTGRAGTIVSRGAIAKYGKDYGNNPVGTGPFKFVEWKENDRIVLVKNPDYFEVDKEGNKLPYIDRVEIKIQVDQSTAVAAITTGQIDGMDGMPLPFAKQLRADPNLVVYSQVGGNWSNITMQCSKGPFMDKNLRLALSYAIDRDQIIKQVFFGEAIVAHGPISPPMTDFYDPEFETGKNGQHYDLEKAKEYMKKSQYPNGVEVNFMVFNAEAARQLSEILQAQLAKIGIKTKIELLEAATWNKRWLAGEYDMFTLTWTADLDPDETIYPELHSGENWNTGKWSNPEFDKLVEIARGTFDVKTRKDAYDKAVKIIVEEAPVAVMAHLKEHKVFRKHVQGFNPIPADLLNLHDVWLDTPKKA
ncbi:MAG: ABC transporter substrate-binding protein [Candidatus Tectomicrobia bacterium]|nr:ABC transporter substrate-binding protein [Candidatus Tectomicrobia bacterium]